MILTGSEIINRVKSNDIVIDPFDQRNVNPNSYNYHLHGELLITEEYSSGPRNNQICSRVEIPKCGLILEPNRLYLGCTSEIIGSNKYVISLIGRSSLGRLGLFLQLSSDLSQLGLYHRWTLEMTVVQPIVIYPNMKIGQVSFWIPEGEIYYYKGKYQNTYEPSQSRFYQELSDDDV